MTKEEAEKIIHRKRFTEDQYLHIRYKEYHYYQRPPMKKQKEFKKRFVKQDVETFNFLQFIRIFYDWARSHYNVSREQIDILLYLHPLGLFSRTEAFVALSIFPGRKYWAFRGLVNNGLIFEYDRFKDKNNETQVIYSLSHKAKRMVNSMYHFTIGDKEIPNGPTALWKINKMGNKNDKYDEILAKFNEKIRKEK